MDKEREIKKIAKILEEADCIEDALFIDFDGMAKALINAGLGDTKQAVREFVEKLKERWTKNMYCIYLRDIDELLQEYLKGEEDDQ